MRVTTTLSLVLILGLLSFYYFEGSRASQPTSNSAALPPIQIFSLSKNDSVSWLQIQNQVSKETMALKKEGTGWQLQSPVSSPAEKLLVEGMVNTLIFAPRLKRFFMEGKTQKDFGLDLPPLRIGIATQKNPEPRYLLLGAVSPVSKTIYAQWEGEREYFLVPPEVEASFERTIYSLRQKKLFRINWNEVGWIHVKGERKEFRIEKKGEKWSWSIPAMKSTIPAEKVSDLIYAFQSLYIKEFLDGQNLNQKDFGLESKDSFLAMGPEGASGERVLLGAVAKGKDSLYAVRERENLVVLISQSNLKSLLEMFEVTFQERVGAARRAAASEIKKSDVDSGKSEKDSGEDSKSLPQGGAKSVASQACAGHQVCSG